MVFCLLLARREFVPPNWDWTAFLKEAEHRIVWAFDPADAEARWGVEGGPGVSAVGSLALPRDTATASFAKSYRRRGFDEVPKRQDLPPFRELEEPAPPPKPLSERTQLLRDTAQRIYGAPPAQALWGFSPDHAKAREDAAAWANDKGAGVVREIGGVRAWDLFVTGLDVRILGRTRLLGQTSF